MICQRCGVANSADALYCSQCGTQISQPAPCGDAGAPALRGERRQITALFCDLVDSTKLVGALDPEEFHDIIRAFTRCCEDIVAGYEGHVSDVRGDGALIFFGYPTSLGDESERAIRAALDIVSAVGKLSLPGQLRLQTRIGIATGLASIDANTSNGPSFAGEVLNLAARLQGLAEPDTVVISSLVKRLAGGFFELADLGEHDLKGFPSPVPAWRVQDVKPFTSRFEALRPELTEFVGRQNEMQQIGALWEKAKNGHGQVVEIFGEAGIGKSRLINQAQRALCDPSQIAKYSCSPHHTGTALHPAIEQLTRILRFRPEQKPDERLASLKNMMVQMGEGHEPHLRWIAALLSLPVDAPQTTAQEARQRTLEALVWWLAAVAKKRPLLMVIEDAHWIDPTSRQLTQMIVDRISTMPVLLIISFRSPYTSPWVGQPPRLMLPLDRLERTDANAIVTNVVGERDLSPDLVDQIIDKAEGIPLFVEELTKMLLGSDAGDGHVQRAQPASGTQLPATLLDLLTARLDQLASAKRVAQTAAVMGREFPYDILVDITGLPRDVLDRSLGQLVESGLIYALDAEAHEYFSFKHALVRDAAYESLLKRDRRDLHAAVAGALEARNANGRTVEPELLAHHYTEAGAMAEALKYWGIAARRALQTSADAEAVSHATRGLEMLNTLPDTAERRRRELELRVVQGWAYWAVKGFASQEVEQTFVRAQELATELGDEAMLNFAARGMFVCRYTRGELRSAYKLAEQEIAHAHKHNNIADLIVGRWSLGATLFWMGEFEAARKELNESLAIYDPVEMQKQIFSSQAALTANNNMHLCWTLWILGYPDQAVARGEQAVIDSRRESHALSQSMSLFWNGIVRMYRGELDLARVATQDLLMVTAQHRIPHLTVCGILLNGAITVAAGDPKSGLQQIQKALTEFRTLRGGLGMPWIMALAADACLRSDARLDAQAAATMGLAMTKVHGERHWEAELHRLKGEALLATVGTDSGEAEAALRQAIDVARQQKALSLELRASMALAHLMAARGERSNAAAHLNDVYSRFTEGFATVDLIAAKALIDELNGAAVVVRSDVEVTASLS